MKKILISVFYKEPLLPLLEVLKKHNVEIYATGGTKKFIESYGLKVKSIESVTGYPSILGGRVKTLHPKVFGGILRRDEEEKDKEDIKTYNIPNFDLIIVELYPFEEAIKNGDIEANIIEKIDIGGVSLIRAAAKNYKNITVISSNRQYSDLITCLNTKKNIDLNMRRRLAQRAFQRTFQYDLAINNYFASKDTILSNLRYGENPHQKAHFYGSLKDTVQQLHGKSLSYNNLLDIEAAINTIKEFQETTFAIFKHNNPCGLAQDNNLKKAYQKALSADTISAFGGILITNKTIDIEVAQEINTLFFEILLAPAYQKNALKLLQRKKNRILLINKNSDLPSFEYRSLLGGFLFQDKNLSETSENKLTIATNKKPSVEELKNLVLANKIVKYTKSNAIILVKNKMLIGSGMGQPSRVDALNQAIEKAKRFDMDLNGAVMASDAFFPFLDCVEIAYKAGIKAVIQPGGSIKDNLSIDYCNNHDVCMLLTNTRHFKH